MKNTSRTKFIFIIAFVLASIFQWCWWTQIQMLDGEMWGNQAKYVYTHDPREFLASQAYGHPGGTLIVGTIALAQTFHLDYYLALQIFMSLFNGFAIACIAVLCSKMGKDRWWWIPVAGVMALDRMNEYASPPTAVASVWAVLLCAYTLYIYEKRQPLKWKDGIIWSILAGIVVVTRVDIGSAALITFLIILLPLLNIKKIIGVIAVAFATFCAFDPFMWFMPLQHMWDLISKVIYHYDAKITPGHPANWLGVATIHIEWLKLLDFSLPLLISVFLVVGVLFLRKRMASPLPPRFVYVLLGMTIIIYSILLTAHYQAPRYFQPIIMIWELFLPLYIFKCIDMLDLSALDQKTQNVVRFCGRLFITIVLIGFPAAILFYLYI